MLVCSLLCNGYLRCFDVLSPITGSIRISIIRTQMFNVRCYSSCVPGWTVKATEGTKSSGVSPKRPFVNTATSVSLGKEVIRKQTAAPPGTQRTMRRVRFKDTLGTFPAFLKRSLLWGCLALHQEWAERFHRLYTVVMGVIITPPTSLQAPHLIARVRRPVRPRASIRAAEEKRLAHSPRTPEGRRSARTLLRSHRYPVRIIMVDKDMRLNKDMRRHTLVRLRRSPEDQDQEGSLVTLLLHLVCHRSQTLEVSIWEEEVRLVSFRMTVNTLRLLDHHRLEVDRVIRVTMVTRLSIHRLAAIGEEEEAMEGEARSE